MLGTSVHRAPHHSFHRTIHLGMLVHLTPQWFVCHVIYFGHTSPSDAPYLIYHDMHLGTPSYSTPTPSSVTSFVWVSLPIRCPVPCPLKPSHALINQVLGCAIPWLGNFNHAPKLLTCLKACSNPLYVKFSHQGVVVSLLGVLATQGTPTHQFYNIVVKVCWGASWCPRCPKCIVWSYRTQVSTAQSLVKAGWWCAFPCSVSKALQSILHGIDLINGY